MGVRYYENIWALSPVDLLLLALFYIVLFRICRAQTYGQWVMDRLDRLVEVGDQEDAGLFGSERESVRIVILRGFLNNKKLGLEGSHTLGLEKQVAKIAISAATA